MAETRTCLCWADRDNVSDAHDAVGKLKDAFDAMAGTYRMELPGPNTIWQRSALPDEIGDIVEECMENEVDRCRRALRGVKAMRGMCKESWVLDVSHLLKEIVDDLKQSARDRRCIDYSHLHSVAMSAYRIAEEAFDELDELEAAYAREEVGFMLDPRQAM